MKNIKAINWFIVYLFIITSCSGLYEDGNEMADQMESSIDQISVENLKTKVDSGGNFVLIDVRQPAEHFTNSIEGSVLIPRGDLEFSIADSSFWMQEYLMPPADTSEIIIYCKSGKRGILAAARLQELGYKNVVNLKGGYDAYNPDLDPNAKAEAAPAGCGG
ncbi:MAG: rhodanese-like domain-containing protein [Bacteroidales bacterium]|nr:rhodanese-like domain-containing protein [Bacteroidales bacterium]